MKDYYALSCKLRKIYKERFRTTTKRVADRRMVKRRKSYPYEVGFSLTPKFHHYHARISILTPRRTYTGQYMSAKLEVCWVISKMKVGNRVLNKEHNNTYGWKLL